MFEAAHKYGCYPLSPDLLEGTESIAAEETSVAGPTGRAPAESIIQVDTRLATAAGYLAEAEEEQLIALIRDMLQAGTDAGDILKQGLIPGMEEIGRRFERGEAFVPEMLLAANVMQAAVALLKPGLVAAAVQPVGTVVLGTVKGDLHDIGKNLVAMMFEGAGFEVVDLGIDVRPEAFVAAVQQHRPQILGMSALLTTTMPSIRRTIEALREAGLHDSVGIIIGGAPVTLAFAQQVGADMYAKDGSAGARLCKQYLGVA